MQFLSLWLVIRKTRKSLEQVNLYKDFWDCYQRQRKKLTNS